MDENYYTNFNDFDLDSRILNQYSTSQPYIKEENFIKNKKNNNNIRVDFHKHKNEYTSHLKPKEKSTKNFATIYRKKGGNNLYSSFNDTLGSKLNKENNNKYNINDFKTNFLSKSINKNEETDYNVNDIDINLNNYNIMNNKGFKKQGKENYSLMESFSKNQEIYTYKNKFNNNEKINLGKTGQLTDNKINNYEIYLDKRDFLSHIKPINELDYLNLESEDIEFNKNLIFKNNNIYINENKNIYLNNSNKILNKNNILSPKNGNLSDKKDDIFNKVVFRNKNIHLNKEKKMNTEKKGNYIRFSKKLAENKISNLSESKKDNLNSKDLLFLKDNENLGKVEKYEKKYNNIDTQYNNNFKNANDNDVDKQFRNSNFERFERKLSEKLNISPSQKRYSIFTNDKKDQILGNVKKEEIYNQLINEKKINNNLKKNIEYLKAEIKKKNNFIKTLYFKNNKNKDIIEKLKIDNESKQKINQNLLAKIDILKKEITLLKSNEQHNLEKNQQNRNRYIKELNNYKLKMNKYQHENNHLKSLLKKNKERQYSTDVSKNYIKNSFINEDESIKDLYNKSVSVSKNKINIQIYKEYLEDKENNYSYDIDNNIEAQVFK